MNDVLDSLYQVILNRKQQKQEGSYTCYLFDQGLDKILKKIGEESAETIIAAKNGNSGATAGEICDLFYHLLVLMAQLDIPYSDIKAVLEQRSMKIGNLKKIKDTDKLT